MLFVEGFRLLVVLIGAILGLEVAKGVNPSSLSMAAGTALGALIAYVVGGVTGRRIDIEMRRVTRRFRDVPPAEIFAGSLIGILGLLLALAAGAPVFVLWRAPLAVLTVALVAWILTFFGVRVGVIKGQQIAAAAGLSRRLAPPSDLLPKESMLLDASALMDRVVLVLGEAGLLPRVVVVPRFVLDQMRSIAEGPDPVASRRARRGLESLDVLSGSFGVHVEVPDEEIVEARLVEDKVAILADRMGLRVGTCSASLVARVGGERGSVVDLRRLTSDLSPDHLPGERLVVDLVRPGRQPRQAIGYLPDGEMVVVNDASHLVGQSNVTVVVASTRPTSQGVLVFGHLSYEDPRDLDLPEREELTSGDRQEDGGARLRRPDARHSAKPSLATRRSDQGRGAPSAGAAKMRIAGGTDAEGEGTAKGDPEGKPTKVRGA